jgi:hypothetical protein
VAQAIMPAAPTLLSAQTASASERTTVLDPERRRAGVYTPSSIYGAKHGVLRTEDPAIEVPLAELFQALDD